MDIGSDTIKFVMGKISKKYVEIDDFFMIKTPKESYQDGRILDMHRLSTAIRHILNDKKRRGKDAVITIQSTSVITREIILPSVHEEELKGMIQFEIQQYFPIHLEDYIVEYKIIEEYWQEGVQKVKILAAALPKTIAEDFLAMMKELKLKPLALDIHSNAIAKLFYPDTIINDEKSCAQKTISVIDIGNEQMNVNIISNGVVQFSRLVPMGGRLMNINLVNALNLSYEEAEKKKTAYGLQKDEHSEQIADDIIQSMIWTSVDSWIQEIQRIFQYYTTRGLGNRVDEVYICGGSSHLHGIDQYLEKALNIPTARIHALNNIKIKQHAVPAALHLYLNAAGALIRK
ncbi:hypothetical protein AN619_07710 [Thermotalea metallivorans]|uniref:Cell division protein FtsA n=2 Tax=Thermotalea metallivorans TaxID=520762 RepID=A0A140L8A4_9FIRM|nr:hypothetical protein AN619_07710 [Thermotalea metallivorans]